VAGILGILVGGLGIHRFYLGYMGIGAIMAAIWLIGFILSCIGIGIIPLVGVGIWGLVEGILILVGQSPFDKDAQGRPLIQ